MPRRDAHRTSGLALPDRTALDATWFQALTELQGQIRTIGLPSELFTVLGPPHAELEAAKKRYDSDGTIPDLLPHPDAPIDLPRTLRLIRDLRRRIIRSEPRLPISRAYARRLDEMALENKLYAAACHGDAAAYRRYNRQLYGTPDKKLFAASCDWLRQQAVAAGDSRNPSVAAVSAALLQVIPDLGGKARHIIPASWVFKRVRDQHFAAGGYYEQLLGDTGNLPDMVTAASGDAAVRQAIRTVGSDYQLADSSDELWGVVHSQRQVVRPPDYHLPREEFIGIVAHEVGSHLLERCNGRRQPLRLLETGLDRYEAGNEGRAFLREQIVYHSPYDMLHEPAWEYILLLHLAVAFAAGLHGRSYGFDRLYRTIFPVCHFFQTLRQPDNPVYAERKARDETWNLLVRVLKGTDGQGGAYYKDLVYLEGNVRAWKLARFNPGLILYGDNGKFDIGRLEHRLLLRTLGIAPPALSPRRPRLLARRS